MKVAKGGVVGDDLGGGTFKVVTPLGEAMDDGKHLFLMDGIVELSGAKLA
jgi:hypothetical protein